MLFASSPWLFIRTFVCFAPPSGKPRVSALMNYYVSQEKQMKMPALEVTLNQQEVTSLLVFLSEMMLYTPWNVCWTPRNQASFFSGELLMLARP